MGAQSSSVGWQSTMERRQSQGGGNNTGNEWQPHPYLLEGESYQTLWFLCITLN